MNGLNITENEFKKLHTKEQMCILYQNTEELKEMIGGYRFRIKWMYAWLGVLTTFGVGFAVWMVDKTLILRS